MRICRVLSKALSTYKIFIMEPINVIQKSFEIFFDSYNIDSRVEVESINNFEYILRIIDNPSIYEVKLKFIESVTDMVYCLPSSMSEDIQFFTNKVMGQFSNSDSVRELLFNLRKSFDNKGIVYL